MLAGSTITPFILGGQLSLGVFEKKMGKRQILLRKLILFDTIMIL